MHQCVQAVIDEAEVLREEHAPCDAAGKLTDRAVEALRRTGGMRLLQSRERGGFEASLSDFFAWVRTAAKYNPSVGWVAGVVGIHPWEIALVDPRLQEEIYGTDHTTWVASPYAPLGTAKPVEGGFVLNGEWPYSTGTDHCRWVVLGAMTVDDAGEIIMPPAPLHLFLPRGDYEIVEGSWNVMGLMGTGSKNVRVKDMFVPDYRTVQHFAMCEGAYNDRQPRNPMYHLPFGGVFSAAIASATFGIAESTIDAYREQLESRVSISGTVGTRDPFQQEALADAEADLAAGIAHLDAMVEQMVADAAAGIRFTPGRRLEFRRNQVRAVQRVLKSVDHLMNRAGSAAVWSTNRLERCWRDLRTSAAHVCNVTDVIYPAWANEAFTLGQEINAFY